MLPQRFVGHDDNDEQQIIADDNQPTARRTRRMPSFSSVVKGVVVAESIQKICLNLEPIIRKAVYEEVQRSISQHVHLLHRPPPLHIQEVDSPPRLKLTFARRLLLPIFTNNKLVDLEKNPLEIHLVDARTNCLTTPTSTPLGSAIKLEVLVLDGDFNRKGSELWTSDVFNAAIVKAREGKRPLLVGTLVVTLTESGVALVDDISFTDNSSWIRSRKFRIGVRFLGGTYHGPRVQEAVSESFMVKDHRGELYKKHEPPSLTDEVWRLKNIGKDGPIHKRLEMEGIKNVQDFLKLHTVDPEKLIKLVGMADRHWNMTILHAKKCDMGGKCYVFRPEGGFVTLTLSPIGEILIASIGGQMYYLHELAPQQMMQVKQLALQAYQQWDKLEEVAKTIVFGANNGLMSPYNYFDNIGVTAPDNNGTSDRTAITTVEDAMWNSSMGDDDLWDQMN